MVGRHNCGLLWMFVWGIPEFLTIQFCKFVGVGSTMSWGLTPCAQKVTISTKFGKEKYSLWALGGLWNVRYLSNTTGNSINDAVTTPQNLYHRKKWWDGAWIAETCVWLEFSRSIPTIKTICLYLENYLKLAVFASTESCSAALKL